MDYKTCYICDILVDWDEYEEWEGKYYCLSCAEFEFEGFSY